MKTFTREQFVDYCRIRGDDEYNPVNAAACAMTQFMQSVDPEVTSSTLPFDGDNEFAFGYNRRKPGDCLVRVSGLDKDYANAIFGIRKFSDLVKNFEKVEAMKNG